MAEAMITCSNCGCDKNPKGAPRCIQCGHALESGPVRVQRSEEEELARRYQQEGVSLQWLGLALVVQAALTGIVIFGLPRAVNQHLPAALARHTQGFGSEFMPTLDEGSLLFMPVLLPSTSLTEVKRIMAWQDEVMSAHPAVASVAGKLGRADTATDP